MLGWLVVERFARGSRDDAGRGVGRGRRARRDHARARASSAGCRRSPSGSSPARSATLAVSVKFRFGYDDALDVVGVHLVGGIVGSLLLGFFADEAVNAAGARRRVLRRRLGAAGRAGRSRSARRIVYSFVVTFAICLRAAARSCRVASGSTTTRRTRVSTSPSTPRSAYAFAERDRAPMAHDPHRGEQEQS